MAFANLSDLWGFLGFLMIFPLCDNFSTNFPAPPSTSSYSTAICVALVDESNNKLVLNIEVRWEPDKHLNISTTWLDTMYAKKRTSCWYHHCDYHHHQPHYTHPQFGPHWLMSLLMSLFWALRWVAQDDTSFWAHPMNTSCHNWHFDKEYRVSIRGNGYRFLMVNLKWTVESYCLCKETISKCQQVTWKARSIG